MTSPLHASADTVRAVNRELLAALKEMRAEYYRTRCDIEACGCPSSEVAVRVEAAIARADELEAALVGSRIAKLAELPEGWHVEGRYRAPRISALAITKAEAVQAMLADLCPVPTFDGGVQIEGHGHGFDIEIEVGPDGNVQDVYAAMPLPAPPQESTP